MEGEVILVAEAEVLCIIVIDVHPEDSRTEVVVEGGEVDGSNVQDLEEGHVPVNVHFHVIDHVPLEGSCKNKRIWLFGFLI